MNTPTPGRLRRHLRRARRNWRFVVDMLRIVLGEWRARSRGQHAAVGQTEPPPARPRPTTPTGALRPAPTFREEGVPQASIVVPVYNQLAQTARCLQSIAAHGAACRFEIIVVDDGSSDDSANWLASCIGVRVHTMPGNSGFVAACNAGAALARGRWLVFLNNDTEVTAGWLDALLGTFATMPDCGLAGAKLIYPDGSLQEAGGIVFDDGEACNYGRGGDPDATACDFVRDADYCSGACIAIPTDLFVSLGGFDTRYAPAYYEDTDLAFAVRAAGYRVIYQPRAEIIHYEGRTAGTDPATGTKRFQAINRVKFAAKWAAVLASQPRAIDFAAAPALVASHGARARVLVVDADYPRPDRDSGSLRMFSLLLLWRELGCHVQFWANAATTRDDAARALEQHGIEIVVAPSRRQALRWWHDHGDGLDIVMLSRLPVALASMRLARRYAPDAILVFDTVDLHFLRVARGAALHGDAVEAAWADALRAQELGLVRRADLTFVVSGHEQKLLGELAPGCAVQVLSNVHPVHGRQAGFAERSGMLLLGNFDHAPNVDAARWMLDEVMPCLRRHGARIALHVVGYGAARALADCAGDDVLIHDFVADLDPVLRRVRLALAPLRYGAGVKGKINMAMSHGVPVVTTSVGAEGMDLVDRRDALVADDAGALAAAIMQLHGDESLWLHLSDHGLDNVRRHFSPQAARAVLASTIARRPHTPNEARRHDETSP